MTNHEKERYFRSIPLLSLAGGCSAFLSRLKETEALKGRITVLEDAANDAGMCVNDSMLRIDRTENSDNGGGGNV